MRTTTVHVPTVRHPEPTVITLSFRDDPVDLAPASATVRYARWRMPIEMPVYRPRGQNAALDSAHDQWDEREELAMRGVLAELLGCVRGCCDPAPEDTTWIRQGGRFIADCALTRDGHPVDLAITEPGR